MGRRDGYDVNEFKTMTCYDVVLHWPVEDNEGWCWTVGVQKILLSCMHMFYQYWYNAHVYYRYDICSRMCYGIPVLVRMLEFQYSTQYSSKYQLQSCSRLYLYRYAID